MRAPLVKAGAYFVLECLKNESKGSSPLSHFASISNCSSEESVHFGVVEGIFRWMVVSGFIESRDIIQIVQEAVVEAYYSPDSGALDDACLQNLITCVGVPFIGSAARIWFGESHGNQYVRFQNARDLAALQPTLSCFFSKFSGSHGDHGASAMSSMERMVVSLRPQRLGHSHGTSPCLRMGLEVLWQRKTSPCPSFLENCS